MKTVLGFVAFNNNYLVNVLLRSFICTNDEGIDVVIFNNGTEEVSILPQTLEHLGKVTILDNNCSDYIDFDKFFLENKPKYPDHWKNNYGSIRHCLALDYIIKNTEYDKLVLCDVDVIFKKNLNILLELGTVVGEIGKNPLMNGKSEWRLLPFLFVIDKSIKDKLSYFDKNRMLLLTHNQYDTGASFLEDIQNNKINFVQIKIGEYISHLGSATWAEGSKRNINKWVAYNAKYISLK